MKYNINVIKSVWPRLRKQSRATLDAILSQNTVCTGANGKTDGQTQCNPIAMTFGSREVPFLSSPRRGPGSPGVNYAKNKPKRAVTV